MSLAFGFEIFNSPYRITRVTQTRGSVNPTTGKAIAPADTETEIAGAFDVPLREEASREYRDRSGPTLTAECSFYTEVDLQIGDVVRVYMEATNTQFRSYKVVALNHPYLFLNPMLGATTRKEYMLIEEGRSRDL